MEWSRRKGHSQVGLPPISDTPQVCDGVDGGQEGYLVLRPAPARLLWELDSFSVTSAWTPMFTYLKLQGASAIHTGLPPFLRKESHSRASES